MAVTDVTVERAVAVVMGVRCVTTEIVVTFETHMTVFSNDGCMVVTAVTIMTVVTLK